MNVSLDGKQIILNPSWSTMVKISVFRLPAPSEAFNWLFFSDSDGWLIGSAIHSERMSFGLFSHLLAALATAEGDFFYITVLLLMTYVSLCECCNYKICQFSRRGSGHIEKFISHRRYDVHRFRFKVVKWKNFKRHDTANQKSSFEHIFA